MSDVTIKFLGDIKDAVAGIDTIKGEAKGIGTAMTRTGTSLTKGLTLPILAAGGAMIGLATKAGRTADELLDLQSITGVSTDKLQEMRFVAGQAGVDQDFYARSVREVIKAQDQLQKGTGPAAEALAQLGIAVKDASGQMRDAQTITDDAITALQGIEDPTTRAALAEDIFKRQLDNLLPVLGLSADEMDRARQSAHDLGAVQSTESLDAANKFRAGMEALQDQVGGIVGMLGGEFAPILSDQIVPLLQDRVVPAIRGFAEFVGGLADTFAHLPSPLKSVAGGLVGVAAAIGPLLIVGGKAITMFGSLKSAGVKALTAMAANPVLLGLGLVAGAIAVITLNSKRARDRVAELRDAILDAGGDTKTAAVNILKAADNTDDLEIAAAKAGITLEDLADLAVGTADNTQQLADKLQAARNSGELTKDELWLLASTLQTLHDDMPQAAADADILAEAHRNAAGGVGNLDGSFQYLSGQVPSYASALSDAAGALGDVEDAADNTKSALEGYAEEQRKLLDPIFALKSAQDKVVDAENKLAGLRADGKTNTSEYKDAQWDLVDAQGNLFAAEETFKTHSDAVLEAWARRAAAAGLAADEIDRYLDGYRHLGEVPLGAQTDLSQLYSGSDLGAPGSGRPPVPRFHGGGTFRAASPGGEGVAILRDGEKVSDPNSNSDATPNYTIYVSGYLDPTDPAATRRVVTELVEHIDRVNQERV